jgi:uncharacterized membrane protein
MAAAQREEPLRAAERPGRAGPPDVGPRESAVRTGARARILRGQQEVHVDGGFVGDIMNMTILTVVGSLVVSIGTTVLIVGIIVWAIRRNSRPQEDPAVAELKRRLAMGEISPVEFEVRMRALEEDH